MHDAHNDMISIEHLSDKELEVLAKNYEKIRSEYDARKKRRKSACQQIKFLAVRRIKIKTGRSPSFSEIKIFNRYAD